MYNQTARWLADYMSEHGISIEMVERELKIPRIKLEVGTMEQLWADEFLRLCAYLNIRPEDILKDMEGKL